MLHKIKKNIVRNVKNAPGWRTRRKMLILECDDWGSIRMPSKEVFNLLAEQGLDVDTSRFNRYDTLATEEDLEKLFDVLNSVRDGTGRPAVMTPMAVMANPDFGKIKSSGFSEYYYEPFTETLKRYYSGDGVIKLWHQGREAGIFVPELHGRDHIAVQLWMEKLREGNQDLLTAFDRGFVALDIPGVPVPASEFRAEFYFTSNDQKAFLFQAIKDGVSLFNSTFGCKPRLFAPGNGIFHPDFDQEAEECGIRFLNVNHAMPYPLEGGALKNRHFITGKRRPGGMIYYTRNCAFEPTEPGYTGINDTLEQIKAAFTWGKPANISTHRANFTGGIEPANREKGLSELDKLLRAILERWPEAEFMSSGDALEIMKSGNKDF